MTVPNANNFEYNWALEIGKSRINQKPIDDPLTISVCLVIRLT